MGSLDCLETRYLDVDEYAGASIGFLISSMSFWIGNVLKRRGSGLRIKRCHIRQCGVVAVAQIESTLASGFEVGGLRQHPATR